MLKISREIAPFKKTIVEVFEPRIRGCGFRHGNRRVGPMPQWFPFLVGSGGVWVTNEL